MSITNYDGIINARANGGTDDPLYIKNTSITPAAAGNWLSLLRSAGSPGPIVASGGNNGSLMDQTNQGAIPLISPSDDIKYLLKAGASVSSVSGFAALLLIDVVWLANYSVGSSPGAITMDALDRYTSGEGLQIGCAVADTLSAITPTVTVTYNPATGDTGSGHTATTGAFAASLASPKMMPLTTPCLPLAAGDSGVTSITNVAISATGTGTIDLFLYKPLCMIPCLNANSIEEWDGFIEIEKNADDLSGCLGFLALAGGTSACATQMAMLKTVNG
jgi:hypothetical protein